MKEATIKEAVKQVQQNFTDNVGFIYGACLKELIEDNGNTVFEWRLNRETDRMCIIEFTSEGWTIFKS